MLTHFCLYDFPSFHSVLCAHSSALRDRHKRKIFCSDCWFPTNFLRFFFSVRATRFLPHSHRFALSYFELLQLLTSGHALIFRRQLTRDRSTISSSDVNLCIFCFINTSPWAGRTQENEKTGIQIQKAPAHDEWKLHPLNPSRLLCRSSIWRLLQTLTSWFMSHDQTVVP